MSLRQSQCVCVCRLISLFFSLLLLFSSSSSSKRTSVRIAFILSCCYLLSMKTFESLRISTVRDRKKSVFKYNNREARKKPFDKRQKDLFNHNIFLSSCSTKWLIKDDGHQMSMNEERKRGRQKKNNEYKTKELMTRSIQLSKDFEKKMTDDPITKSLAVLHFEASYSFENNIQLSRLKIEKKYDN